MSQFTIPLDQLRFGHEAVPPINARKVGREAELESLAASIVAHGLGQALNVRQIDGGYFVVDGNRRLAALRLLSDRHEITPDHEVKCDLSSDGDAGEFSLAMNIERQPMHEADQYEKFVELNQGGLSPEQISARFGIESKRVKRILALGALSPVILEAWRSGELGNQAADLVRAFTMAAGIAEQERVYLELKASDNLSAWQVRRAFGADDRVAAGYVNYIGIKAYEAAGGYVTEDLFGDNHAVSNPALALQLANEKLSAKLQELVEDGWAWAVMDTELPYNWTYSWQKLPANKKTATADEKAKAGCVAKFSREGVLDITYGVIKPSQAKVAATKSDVPAAAKEAVISDALMQRLSVQLTQASKDAITANPKTALAAVVAGMMGYQMYGGVPLRIRVEGILKEPAPAVPEAFDALFVRLHAMTLDELLVALARQASAALDMSSANKFAPPLGKTTNICLVEALEQEPLQEALRARFDAADYFQTAPKFFTLAAIRAALGDDQLRAAEKLKKGDLVAFALTNVPATGWLPPELRTAHYGGPAAGPAPVDTPKKSKKKPAKEVA